MLATRKAHGEGAFVGQHANEAWAYLDRILELHSPYRQIITERAGTPWDKQIHKHSNTKEGHNTKSALLRFQVAQDREGSLLEAISLCLVLRQ